MKFAAAAAAIAIVMAMLINTVAALPGNCELAGTCPSPKVGEE